MPNIKSSKKRVKVNSAKTLQNQVVKSELKTTIKNFDAALAEGNKETVDNAYNTVIKKLDQAVAKGVLHKNNAARKKSKITLKVKAI